MLDPSLQGLSDDKEPEEISSKKFLIKTFLWLPVAFSVWYWLATFFTMPALFLSDLILPVLMPNIVTGVEQSGYWGDVVTSLTIAAENGKAADMVLSFNALKYGYGLPLIFSMMLAIPGSIYAKLDNITYGFIIVIFVQTWGVCFEAMSSLLLKYGGDIHSQIVAIAPAFSNETLLNLIAACYQLGVLILPAVIPLAFWVLRHQVFLDGFSKR